MDWIISKVRELTYEDTHATISAHAQSSAFTAPTTNRKRRRRAPSPEVRPVVRAKTNTSPTADADGLKALEIAHMLQ